MKLTVRKFLLLAVACIALLILTIAFVMWREQVDNTVYQPADVIGLWEHTFEDLDPGVGKVQVALSIKPNGKFFEKAFIPGRPQPEEAEGCWKIEPGRLILDGCIAFDSQQGWYRGSHWFDLRKVDGTKYLLGGIIPDPDSDEYWDRESEDPNAPDSPGHDRPSPPPPHWGST